MRCAGRGLLQRAIPHALARADALLGGIDPAMLMQVREVREMLEAKRRDAGQSSQSDPGTGGTFAPSEKE
jgi:hypothetical protein